MTSVMNSCPVLPPGVRSSAYRFLRRTLFDHFGRRQPGAGEMQNRALIIAMTGVGVMPLPRWLRRMSASASVRAPMWRSKRPMLPGTTFAISSAAGASPPWGIILGVAVGAVLMSAKHRDLRREREDAEAS